MIPVSALRGERSYIEMSKQQIEFDFVTTRGGDNGFSTLFSGERVHKADVVFEVLGDLDELNSWIGVLRISAHRFHLVEIQKALGSIMGQVATSPHSDIFPTVESLRYKDVEVLEKRQKKMMEKVYIPTEFITPGDGLEIGAQFDITRAVCRRAERHMVKLIKETNRQDLFVLQQYLNRLSDYLFVAARHYD